MDKLFLLLVATFAGVLLSVQSGVNSSLKVQWATFL